MSNLTLGSLFDGSGGFPLGAIMNGITPIWASEIEPFPIRVTTKRLPFIKHLGDVSKISGGEITPVDIITFGSPCTDLSVAGKRAGLEGHQSVLFFEAIRIIREMREKTNGEYPRYIVWENVPGAFSSSKGQDFRAVLEEIVKVKDKAVTIPMPKNDKWMHAGEIVGRDYSVAWRVLDAQYFGVPQRRRRIYLVADFRGECAGKILFEFEGLSGYTPQSFGSWQRTATNTKESIRTTSNSSVKTMFENHSQDTRYKEVDVAPTVSATYGTGGNNQPFCIQGSVIGRDVKNGPNGQGIDENGVSFTLNTVDKHAVAYSMTTGSFSQVRKNQSPTIAARDYKDPSIVTEPIFAIDRESFNSGMNYSRSIGIVENGVNSTLKATGPSAVAQPTSFYPQMKAECQSPRLGVANTIVNGTNPGYQNGLIESTYAVRRLTPTECAKLQGFPSWWAKNLKTENPTDDDISFWRGVFETHRQITNPNKKPKSDKQIIKWLKSPHSDSAEYKMWGNGVALPCVCFVLAGIKWTNKNGTD